MSARQPHIGLNLIFLVPGETGGMETVARELIPALVEAAPEGMRFTAFLNRELGGSSAWRETLASLAPGALDTVTLPVRAASRAQWVAGEQALLPRAGARAGVVLMHSLASTAPLWGRFRRVVTVHDLIYARFPEAHSAMRRRAMGVLVPAGARRSDRVIVDSRSTRDDLLSLVGIPSECVDVVPLGLGSERRAAPEPEAQVRERLGLAGRAVLLGLSAKRPHKNLPALLGALARIPSAERPVLVLPGYRTSHEDDLRVLAQELGLGADVRLPGWVPEAELEGLWAIASAFVFPSLYEGFGLPVLEAMARGVPVACSRAASLVEVAGEAALLFDPRDEQAIADSLRRLMGDAALRERLRERGLERAREFTWQRTARLTLDSYARALGVPPSPA